MTNATKTFTFSKIDFNGTGRRINTPEVELRLSYDDKGRPVVSICGTIWNSKKTDCICAGQCLETMNKFGSLRRDRTFKRLYQIWIEYHLNHMMAGTEAQMAALKGRPMAYREAVEYLKSIDLYEDHGYKYGSAWLYKTIPDEVVNEIKTLLTE